MSFNGINNQLHHTIPAELLKTSLDERVRYQQLRDQLEKEAASNQRRLEAASLPPKISFPPPVKSHLWHSPIEAALEKLLQAENNTPSSSTESLTEEPDIQVLEKRGRSYRTFSSSNLRKEHEKKNYIGIEKRASKA